MTCAQDLRHASGLSQEGMTGAPAARLCSSRPDVGRFCATTNFTTAAFAVTLAAYGIFLPPTAPHTAPIYTLLRTYIVTLPTLPCYTRYLHLLPLTTHLHITFVIVDYTLHTFFTSSRYLGCCLLLTLLTFTPDVLLPIVDTFTTLLCWLVIVDDLFIYCYALLCVVGVY